MVVTKCAVCGMFCARVAPTTLPCKADLTLPEDDLFKTAFETLKKICEDASAGAEQNEIHRRLQNYARRFLKKLEAEAIRIEQGNELLRQHAAELERMVKLDRKYPARHGELKRPN